MHQEQEGHALADKMKSEQSIREEIELLKRLERADITIPPQLINDKIDTLKWVLKDE